MVSSVRPDLPKGLASVCVGPEPGAAPRDLAKSAKRLDLEKVKHQAADIRVALTSAGFRDAIGVMSA